MEIINSIRKKRKSMRISRKELAARIGVSQMTLFNIEHGKSLSSLATFFNACDALGLEVTLTEKNKKTN